MSERYVTPEHVPAYQWLGRLSMALALSVKERHPHAKEVLEEYLAKGGAAPEVKNYYRGRTPK